MWIVLKNKQTQNDDWNSEKLNRSVDGGLLFDALQLVVH